MKKEKQKNIVNDTTINAAVIILSIIILLLVFAPSAEYRNYYITPAKIGGISFLLYIIPFITAGIAIASLYRKIDKGCIWYVSAGGLGVLISLFVASQSVSYLNNALRMFSNNNSIHSHIGIGMILIILGYVAITAIGFILANAKSKEDLTARS